MSQIVINLVYTLKRYCLLLCENNVYIFIYKKIVLKKEIIKKFIFGATIDYVTGCNKFWRSS